MGKRSSRKVVFAAGMDGAIPNPNAMSIQNAVATRTAISVPTVHQAWDASHPSWLKDVPLNPDDLRREMSYRATWIYDRSQFFPYNPDDLSLIRTPESYPGKGMWPKHGPFAIYRRMRTDEQVKAVLTYKKLARISHGFNIAPFDKTPLATEIADFVRWSLDRVEGGMHSALFEIMSALDFGFSSSEKIFEYVNSGKHQGKVALKRLRTRAPETIRFDVDEFGTIKALRQFLPNMASRQLPRDKFVVYTYHGEFQNAYGFSDLRAAFRPWWSKDFLIKAWNIFLDRFGSPIRKMKIPAAAMGDTALMAKAQELLESIQTDCAVTVPEGFDLEFMKVGETGQAGYADAIDRYDRAIAKALLYPELGGLTERKGGGGSQHMAVSQMTGYDLVLMDLGLDLESIVVTDQIIRPMVEMNYGTEAPMPIFKLGAMTQRDNDAFIKNVTEAAAGGIILWGFAEEQVVRKTLDLPDITQEDWEVRKKAASDAAAGAGPDNQDLAGMLAGSGAPGTKPSPFGRPSPFAPRRFSDPGLSPQFRKTKADSDIDPSTVVEKPKKGKKAKYEPSQRTTLTRFEKRVNFAAIDEGMTHIQEVAVRQFGKIIADIGRKATAFVVNKKLLQDPRAVTKILDFEFSPLPIRKLLESVMMAEYLFGKFTVVHALRRAGLPIPEKFADDLDDMDEALGEAFEEPGITLEDIKNLFTTTKRANAASMQVPYQPGELARIADSFRVKAHAIAGNESQDVLDTVQRMLQKAVDNGWSEETWKHNLEEDLDEKAGTVFGNYPGGDDAHHANTVFRTEMNRTFNEGRVAAMNDPELGVTVVGVQYSAILDTATTDICREADGIYMKLNNPNLAIPGLHWNCRTLLIEVLEGEDDDIEWADELPIPPMDGFGLNDFAAHTCACHRFQTQVDKTVDEGQRPTTLGVLPVYSAGGIMICPHCHRSIVNANEVSNEGTYFVHRFCSGKIALPYDGKPWKFQQSVDLKALAKSSESWKQPGDANLPKPAVIYTHGEDMDGVVSGVLAQRLAHALFGQVIPVKPVRYEDIRYTDFSGACWICDLGLGDAGHGAQENPIATNPAAVVFDHHEGWPAKLSGPSYISRDGKNSATGMVAQALREHGLDDFPKVVEMIEAGDLFKKDDPQFEYARLAQFFMQRIGFEAMFKRGQQDPNNYLDLGEINSLRDVYRRENDMAFQQATATIKKASWGSIVQFKLGDRSVVLERILDETGEPVAMIDEKPSGDVYRVSFRSKDGTDTALKIAKWFGGGGHPSAAGATLQAPSASVVAEILKTGGLNA